MNNSKQTDFMAMNVTWSLEDLELYDNQIGVGESTIVTLSKTILLAMGIIAQTTFYKGGFQLIDLIITELESHMTC